MGTVIAPWRAAIRRFAVWLAGSNRDGAGSFCNGNLECDPGGADTRELSVEIFEPWYYRRSDRPIITSCPGNFSGAPATRTVSIGGSQGMSITKVALLAAGSVTHAFNSDQRLVWLDITGKTATNVTVNIPYTEPVAPPGDYLLFVLKQK